MENQFLTEDQQLKCLAIDAQVSAMNEDEFNSYICQHPDERCIPIGGGLVYDYVWGAYEL
jgi:hypothetical protein